MVALLPILFLAGCATSKAYKQGIELEREQKYDEALASTYPRHWKRILEISPTGLLTTLPEPVLRFITRI